LNDSSNIIGAVIGSNFTAMYLKELSSSIYNITTTNQLAVMLSKKRLDYIFTLELDGSGNYIGIDKSKYNTFKISRVEAYHYIHRRIEGILPELTLSLKSVIDENK
tara:strand:+ start:3321 stop:3638 length:318 start_codon:yes stop_codon:yes gene_type:complete